MSRYFSDYKDSCMAEAEDDDGPDDDICYCEKCGDLVKPRYLLCSDCGDYEYWEGK